MSKRLMQLSILVSFFKFLSAVHCAIVLTFGRQLCYQWVREDDLMIEAKYDWRYGPPQVAVYILLLLLLLLLFLNFVKPSGAYYYFNAQ